MLQVQSGSQVAAAQTDPVTLALVIPRAFKYNPEMPACDPTRFA